MKPIDFEIEDLPEQFRHIAEIIGFHSTKKLMMEMAGVTLTFPVHWPPQIIKRFINAHYNGKNADDLAARLGMSRQTIFRYLNEKMGNATVQNISMLKPNY